VVKAEQLAGALLLRCSPSQKIEFKFWFCCYRVYPNSGGREHWEEMRPPPKQYGAEEREKKNERELVAGRHKQNRRGRGNQRGATDGEAMRGEAMRAERANATRERTNHQQTKKGKEKKAEGGQ
jgi:hypothetical protein